MGCRILAGGSLNTTLARRNRRGATSDIVALRSAKVACGKTDYLSEAFAIRNLA